MRKLTPKDVEKINEAYTKKYKEFNELTLEELRQLYTKSLETGNKRIGGIYKRALFDVVTVKLQQESTKEAVENALNKEDNKTE